MKFRGHERRTRTCTEPARATIHRDIHAPASEAIRSWRRERGLLDLDIRRENDDAARRHAKELRRLRAAALQEREGARLDPGDAGPRPRAHQVPAEEERGVLGEHVKSLAARAA